MFLCAQGALDLRYLSARFAKGKQVVESWMQQHHRYVEVTSGLSDAHADLLQFQGARGAGGSAFLGLFGGACQIISFLFIWMLPTAH